ncbi:MAG: hypothetical protein EWV50_14300 [Microcystis aeruginosa Ma_MB_F_20061100_S20]|uniref:Uncharacterized protein n=1 Tax=Microcystis aeruginosa Ma_MB_F_20061100_S20D TaxID=2486253 RepID=A0A552EJU8_MICAE|nr:MAG: hypothetical protein EWV78_12930 [Microcystis aeruginosa Ma_MB_F_20061100_S20D]TRU36965.1 MAG: hypothetical protein EWV50_14300 [Microcystis aeruginosa Ma_MB_F_20061100_S20]
MRAKASVRYWTKSCNVSLIFIAFLSDSRQQSLFRIRLTHPSIPIIWPESHQLLTFEIILE